MYPTSADTELHHHTEGKPCRSLSKQAHFEWTELDEDMKIKKRNYPIGSLHEVWDRPGKSTKSNFSVKAVKTIHNRENHHIDRDNPEDTIKMKEDMKVRKEIDLQKTSYLIVMLWRRKIISLGREIWT